MTREAEFRNMARGCLIGLSVGDALGLALEILTHDEIVLGVGDPLGVTGFITDTSACNEEIKKRLGRFPPGSTSDDTQLAEACTISLIRSRGYDRADQVRAFVAAYRQSTEGWGGTTRDAAKAFADWFFGDSISNETGGKQPGRDPLSDAPPPTANRGLGNGVAMKIAPLALYHALAYPDHGEDFFENVRSLGLMTHGDQRAWIAAAGVAYLVTVPFLRYRIRDDGWGLIQLLYDLQRHTQQMQSRAALNVPHDDLLTTRYAQAVLCADDAEILRETAGTGCSSLESIPFSIATFFRHPEDFRAAVLEAVNAGKDTDTNGAMVGAMVGANVGETGIPSEWIAAVPACARMRDLADQMVDIFYLKK